ncbi:CoA-binding protein, partial [Candidatus Parvarchaeota archaeon]|nr:CoA-binding protein [Candidatus Parvarchaeota archaeon]
MGAEIGEESRIKEMLASAKTIAIVGLSDNPQRDSYKVGK